MRSILSRACACRIAKSENDIRWKKFLKLFAQVQRLFRAFFREQADALADAVATRYEPRYESVPVEKSGFLEGILDLFADDPKFRLILEKLLVEIFDEWADDEYREKIEEVRDNVKGGELSENLTLPSYEADNYAKNRAAELMHAVTDTTKKEVRALFNEGWTNNWTQEEMTRAIKDKFSNFSEYRAALIAQMETANAYEEGKLSQFRGFERQLGLTGWKRSQTQHDSVVRESHRANEAEGWIPSDQKFKATDTMRAPHGFRCRCVTSFALFPPDEKHEKERAMRDFERRIDWIADEAGVSMKRVPKSEYQHIQILRKLSVLNARMPGKRNGKPSKIKRDIYEVKNKVIEDIIERIEENELKGKYKIYFDKQRGMPWVTFYFPKNKAIQYHIPDRLYSRLQKKYSK